MKNIKLYEEFTQPKHLPGGVEVFTISGYFEFASHLTEFSEDELKKLESLGAFGDWDSGYRNEIFYIKKQDEGTLEFTKGKDGGYSLKIGTTKIESFPYYFAKSLDDLIPLAIDALNPEGIGWSKIK